MDKKKIFIVVIIILGIFILIFPYLFLKKNTNKTQEVTSPAINEPTTTVDTATTSIPQGTVRTEAPKDVKIPTPTEVLSEADKKIIAVPTVTIAAAPGITSQFRNFNIKAVGDKYEPSRIIGKVGDTIHVNFTAVDKDYDIVFPSYNMKQTAKKGETKVLEFQANQDGNFLYYCEVCGGVNGNVKGNIIIAK